MEICPIKYKATEFLKEVRISRGTAGSLAHNRNSETYPWLYGHLVHD